MLRVVLGKTSNLEWKTLEARQRRTTPRTLPSVYFFDPSGTGFYQPHLLRCPEAVHGRMSFETKKCPMQLRLRKLSAKLNLAFPEKEIRLLLHGVLIGRYWEASGHLDKALKYLHSSGRCHTCFVHAEAATDVSRGRCEKSRLRSLAVSHALRLPRAPSLCLYRRFVHRRGPPAN